MNFRSICVFVCFMIVSVGCLAWEPAALVPNVVDETKTLSTDDIASVNQAIRDLRSSKNILAAVYIIDRLGSQSIETAADKTFRKWKLGKKGIDNGLLFIFSLKDHRARIEVGYGLEGDIPDIVARRILDEKILPLFKQSRYADGLLLGLQAVKVGLGESSVIAPSEDFTDDQAHDQNLVPEKDFFALDFDEALRRWEIWALIVFSAPAFFKSIFYVIGYAFLQSQSPPTTPTARKLLNNPVWSKGFFGTIFFVLDLANYRTWLIKIFLLLVPGLHFAVFPELGTSAGLSIAAFIWFSLTALFMWPGVLKPLMSDKAYRRSVALIRLQRIQKRVVGTREIFGKSFTYTRSSSSSSGSSFSSSSGGGSSGGGGASSSW